MKDEKVILYTLPNCPKCKVLMQMLTDKKIKFEINSDVEYMEKELRISTVPQIETKDGLLDFFAAIQWIRGDNHIS